MDKKEICDRINAVLKSLDGGIEVRGALNAGNLAACYTILSEVLQVLVECDITPMGEDTEES